MRWAIVGMACAALVAVGLAAVLARPETPPNVETRDQPQTQLYVQTDPAGATVQVDKQSTAESPHVFELSLPPGVDKVLVEIQKDGFQSKTQKVTIRGGRVTRIEFKMEPAPDISAGASKPEAIGPEHGTATTTPSTGPAHASRLDFRIAPVVASAAEKDSVVTLDQQQIDRYCEQLAEEGPEAGRARGDDFCWFPIQCAEGSELITSEHDGQLYILLSNRLDEIMIRHEGDKRLWGLRQVGGASDPNGNPSISGEFDTEGARLMRELTTRCLLCRLAILVDDQAISAPKIQNPISERFVIQGSFTRTEVDQIVRSLLTGMVWRQVDEQGRPLFSVHLVVDKDRMTFEGREITWEELPELLEQVPRRPDTTLNIAVATDEISWRQKNEAVDRAAHLAQRFGFRYLSFIGVHPIGSKSPQPPPPVEHTASEGE